MGEFRKALKLFAELKKICPTLDSINLGGGLPIRNNLGFEYDYKYMINELVRNIKEVCQEEGIDEPDIYTEFGKYTVGESGAIIFSVLEQKQQNDSELWYLIDNSLMNTIRGAALSWIFPYRRISRRNIRIWRYQALPNTIAQTSHHRQRRQRQYSGQAL